MGGYGFFKGNKVDEKYNKWCVKIAKEKNIISEQLKLPNKNIISEQLKLLKKNIISDVLKFPKKI